MKTMSLAEIAQHSGASGGGDDLVHRVVVDSREAGPGCLFVALPGANCHGHQFVPEVLQRGGYALVEPSYPARDHRLICAQDPLVALGQLASAYVRARNVKVVAVTGSNGKTTTKDMIAAALSGSFFVHKSLGNYNTEIGLPLSILAMAEDTEIAVLEMGMRGPGQIRRLCQIAGPSIGVITNIGPVHLELLGSQAAIADAKGELLESLPDNGLAILNGDDSLVRKQAGRTNCAAVYYGLADNNQVRAEDIRTDHRSTLFHCHWRGGDFPVTMNVLGRHNVYNALAAIAVAVQCNVSVPAIQRALGNLAISDMRLQLLQGQNGTVVLNDAYNASPASMRAALETLIAFSETRTVAILGDMLELGSITFAAHRQIGAFAAERADVLVFVGQFRQHLQQGAATVRSTLQNVHLFAEVEDLQRNIWSVIQPKDTVLVKASRGLGLDTIADAIKEGK